MSLLLILIGSLLFGINTSTSMPDFTYMTCTLTNFGMIDPNSTFQKNLDHLFSTLTSKATIQNGFYNSTAGVQASSDRVYGLFMCRGDVTPDTCRVCVSTATQNISGGACRSTEAVIWYEQCMLRYSNKDFFSTYEIEDPIPIYTRSHTVKDSALLMQRLSTTMTEIATKAASNLSGKKFATKKVSFEPSTPLYCLGQCTPDLSVDDCTRCLRTAIVQLPNGTQGAKMLSSSCNIRYEMYPFYSSVEKETKERRSKEVIIIVALSAVVLIAIICIIIMRRKAKKQQQNKDAQDSNLATNESLQYDFITLGAATNNFSDENIIGEGGFGAVYKGILSDGKEIAIKRLFKHSGNNGEEFKNEVDLVARLQHRNLVRLLGFCLDGDTKLLVYEFVTNKSLDYFLFNPEKRTQLNWSKRYNIVLGVARGMLYLHEESRTRIIHRDLKASNILLDANMNPKISDFGTARIFGADQTHDSTNRVAGTFGYMAPEYILHGQYSEKSDVYSFGVLALEIIRGIRRTNFYQQGLGEDLLSYAWKEWRNGTPLEVADPALRGAYSSDEVIKCIHLSLLCVQENVELRPNMGSIVLMLYMCSVNTLPLPQLPAFVSQSTIDQPLSVTNDDKRLHDQSNIRWMPESVKQDSVTDILPR